MGYKIGNVYNRDGKIIYITGGQFYGETGRISNFWTWREIKKDGSLGKEDYGYGCHGEPVEFEIERFKILVEGFP